MDPYTQFKRECDAEIATQGKSTAFAELTNAWVNQATETKYCYHFEWLGRPVIQYPQDIVAMQEVLFSVQPDLVIETGVAHGGSLIFTASILELIALCGGPKEAEVLGIDIDIRAHNRTAIEAHPMSRRITLMQGSSVAPDIVSAVRAKAADKKKVLVCLDSNHTHAHVLEELQHYAPLTSVGSYCVVFDTIIEDQPKSLYPDRPWGPGDNPKTAVFEYLKSHPEFVIDKAMDHKLMISVVPDGFLKRIA